MPMELGEYLPLITERTTTLRGRLIQAAANRPVDKDPASKKMSGPDITAAAHDKKIYPAVSTKNAIFLSAIVKLLRDHQDPLFDDSKRSALFYTDAIQARQMEWEYLRLLCIEAHDTESDDDLVRGLHFVHTQSPSVRYWFTDEYQYGFQQMIAETVKELSRHESEKSQTEINEKSSCGAFNPNYVRLSTSREIAHYRKIIESSSAFTPCFESMPGTTQAISCQLSECLTSSSISEVAEELSVAFHNAVENAVAKNNEGWKSMSERMPQLEETVTQMQQTMTQMKQTMVQMEKSIQQKDAEIARLRNQEDSLKGHDGGINPHVFGLKARRELNPPKSNPTPSPENNREPQSLPPQLSCSRWEESETTDIPFPVTGYASAPPRTDKPTICREGDNQPETSTDRYQQRL